MQDKKEKTWHITIERQSGITDEYYIKAETLYDAFIQYSKAFFPYNIVGLHITEARHNESKEERACTGLS